MLYDLQFTVLEVRQAMSPHESPRFVHKMAHTSGSFPVALWCRVSADHREGLNIWLNRSFYHLWNATYKSSHRDYCIDELNRFTQIKVSDMLDLYSTLAIYEGLLHYYLFSCLF